MKLANIQELQITKLIKMVYQASGINLHDGKKELLKAKIAKRMRVVKINSVSDYLDFLMNDSSEFLEFLDTVTTNHTFFFRENKGCEYLVNKFSNTSLPLNIWCAASSTGDEPYSIAMQLLNIGCKFNIIASDLSHTVLEFARRGIYPMERTKNVPIPILHKYFQKGDGNYKGYVKIKDEVKKTIKFKKYNLIKDPLPQQMFDIIFCRNVMIYFDDITTEKVVNKLCKVLVPGGYFLIGQAESLMSISHKLQSVPKIASTYRLSHN